MPGFPMCAGETASCQDKAGPPSEQQGSYKNHTTAAMHMRNRTCRLQHGVGAESMQDRGSVTTEAARIPTNRDACTRGEFDWPSPPEASGPIGPSPSPSQHLCGHLAKVPKAAAPGPQSATNAASRRGQIHEPADLTPGQDGAATRASSWVSVIRDPQGKIPRPRDARPCPQAP